MGFLVGRSGQRSRETYPEPRFAASGPAGVVSAEDWVTGNVNVTSSTPVPFLRQDGGDPLELDFSSAEAGDIALVWVGGSMNNGGTAGGSSDQAFIQPVVNGVAFTAQPLVSSYLEGGQPTAIGGQWRIPLTGPSSITFEVWGFSGNLIGCIPNDVSAPYLRTAVMVSGVLTS